MKGSNRAGWIRESAARLLRDEAGGEAMEYALIVGLLLITAIAVISSVGPKALAR